MVLMVTVPPAPLVFVKVKVCVGLFAPTVVDAKVRLAGASVAVSAAGVVADTSFDRALSLADCHTPPPVPDALAVDAKVNVFEVGWPVEVKVPLNAA